MKKESAGLLLFRRPSLGRLQVLLVHPGGPFWAKKDDGAWSIPKGEFDSTQEEARDAAVREFAEETGLTPSGTLITLTSIKQKSGKTVHAWAVEGDFDPSTLKSNTFEMEWPRGSGVRRSFPEVDKAAWFDAPTARIKLSGGQAALVDELAGKLGVAGDEDPAGQPKQLKLL